MRDDGLMDLSDCLRHQSLKKMRGMLERRMRDICLGIERLTIQPTICHTCAPVSDFSINTRVHFRVPHQGVLHECISSRVEIDNQPKFEP